MMLTLQYMISGILCDALLLYGTEKFYCRLLSCHLRKKAITEMIFIITFLSLLTARFAVKDYLLQYTLRLLSILLPIFVLPKNPKKKIAAAGCTIFILSILEISLTELSASFNLGLFNPPSLNASIGAMLFTASAWVLFLLLLLIKSLLTGQKRSFSVWAIHFCGPITTIYFLGFALIADFNLYPNRVALYAVIPILSDVDQMDLTFFISSVILLFLNMLFFFLCDRSGRISRLEAERNMIARQNEDYQTQLTIIQNSSTALRTLRHDMKNHLSAIRVLVSEENTAGTIAYLDTLTQQVQTFASISDTGNLIIDSLINGKFQSCSSDGIEFKCNLQIPRNLRFDPYILNIILGNLIDNALDAVRKEDCLEKYIDLKIQYTQRNLVIKLKNTYNGKLKKQGDNFLTTKDNPQIHGLGLKSVRNAVEKVGGIFDLQYDARHFSAFVIFPLSTD